MSCGAGKNLGKRCCGRGEADQNVGGMNMSLLGNMYTRGAFTSARSSSGVTGMHS